MKWTETQKAKQRQRAKNASDARKRAEETNLEWDQLIDHLKAYFNAIEEKHPR